MRPGKSVGELYVRVVADATGVADELENELERGTNRFERSVAAAGKRGGEEYGDEFGEGFYRGFEKKNAYRRLRKEGEDFVEDTLRNLDKLPSGQALRERLLKGEDVGIDFTYLKNQLGQQLRESFEFSGEEGGLGFTADQIGALGYDILTKKLDEYRDQVIETDRVETQLAETRLRKQQEGIAAGIALQAKAETRAIIENRRRDIADARLRERLNNQRIRKLASKSYLRTDLAEELIRNAEQTGIESGEQFADEFYTRVIDIADRRKLTPGDWYDGSQAQKLTQELAEDYQIPFGEAQDAVIRRTKDKFGRQFRQQLKKSFEGLDLPKSITNQLTEAFGEGAEDAAQSFLTRFNRVVEKRRFKPSDFIDGSPLSRTLKRLSKIYDIEIGELQKLAKRRNQQIFGSFAPKKNPWQKLKDFNRGFLRNMDRTVRAVLLTVIGFGQEAAFLIQGLGAALGGLASSAAFGLGGLLALAPVLTAAGGAFAVLIAGALNAEKVIPGPLKALKNGFEELGLSVSKRLFAGFSATSGVITGTIIPQLTRGLGSLADVMSGGLGDFADLFARFDLGDLFTDLAPTLATLQNGFLYLTEGVLNFIRLAIPAGERLAGTFEDLSAKFLNFTSAKSGQAAITDFLDKGVTSLRRWGRLLASTTSLLSGFFQAGRKEGDSLVVNLTKLVNKWDEWVRSVEGQESLKEFFDTAKPALKAVGTVLGGIKDGFSNLLGENAEQKLEAFGEGLADIISSLGEMIRILGDAGIFEAIVKIISTLAAALEDGAPILEAFAEGVSLIAYAFSALPGFINGPIAAFGALFLLLRRFGAGRLAGGIASRIRDWGTAFYATRLETAKAGAAIDDATKKAEKGGRRLDKVRRGFTRVGTGLSNVATAAGPAGLGIGVLSAVALAGAAGFAKLNDEIKTNLQVLGSLDKNVRNIYRTQIEDVAKGTKTTLGEALNAFGEGQARNFGTRFGDSIQAGIGAAVSKDSPWWFKYTGQLGAVAGGLWGAITNFNDDDLRRPVSRFIDSLEEEAASNPVQVRIATQELLTNENISDKERVRLEGIIAATSGAAGETRVYNSVLGENRRQLEAQERALQGTQEALRSVADANAAAFSAKSGYEAAKDELTEVLDIAQNIAGFDLREAFQTAGKNDIINLDTAAARDVGNALVEVARAGQEAADKAFTAGDINLKGYFQSLRDVRTQLRGVLEEFDVPEQQIQNVFETLQVPRETVIGVAIQGVEDASLSAKEFKTIVNELPQKKIVNILANTADLDFGYLQDLLNKLPKEQKLDILVDLLPKLPEGELRDKVQTEIFLLEQSATIPLKLNPIFPDTDLPGAAGTSVDVTVNPVGVSETESALGNVQSALDGLLNGGTPWDVNTKTNANKVKTSLDNAAEAADTLDKKNPVVTVTVEYVTVGTPPAQVTPPSFIPVTPGQRNMPEGLRSGLFPMRNTAIAPLGYSTTGIRRASTTPTNGGGKTVNNYITVNSNASDPKLIADSIVNRSVILERR